MQVLLTIGEKVHMTGMLKTFRQNLFRARGEVVNDAVVVLQRHC